MPSRPSTSHPPSAQLHRGEPRADRRTVDARSQPSPGHGFMQPMTDAGERLGRAWGIVGHMHSVMDVPEWREAYNAMLPEVTGFYAELGQNVALFAKVKALRDSAEYATLSPTQQAHRRQRPARLPPLRRRTAGRQEAALQGNPGRDCRHWRPSSPRTCSTPPTPTPNGSPTKRIWRAFPMTSRPPRAPPPRRTAGRAGNSRCTRPPTSR